MMVSPEYVGRIKNVNVCIPAFLIKGHRAAGFHALRVSQVSSSIVLQRRLKDGDKSG